MKIRALPLAVFIPAMLAAPVLFAQENGAPWQPPLQQEETPREGADLIGRGVAILMDNFMKEVGPSLDQLGQNMSGAVENLAPALREMAILADDLGNYQMPERLENGDIILRRKPGAPPPPPIGHNLRNFPQPDNLPGQVVPRDPHAPEFEL